MTVVAWDRTITANEPSGRIGDYIPRISSNTLKSVFVGAATGIAVKVAARSVVGLSGLSGIWGICGGHGDIVGRNGGFGYSP